MAKEKLIIGFMKYIYPVLLLLAACKAEPVSLNYNKDACEHCKMTLTDRRFGGELVTTKGKVFKFDDANCMINYLNASVKDERDLAYKLMIDYTKPGTLIEAGNAFYMRSNEIHSPMNSQVAAFEAYDTMTLYKKKLKGIYLSWGELVTQYK